MEHRVKYILEGNTVRVYYWEKGFVFGEWVFHEGMEYDSAYEAYVAYSTIMTQSLQPLKTD